MIDHASPSFAEWLRTQLRARRMSQRQLADRAGVDHSTISRLLSLERMPSLGTATKLAHALGSRLPDGSVVPHLALVGRDPAHPLARVERALRSDGLLREEQVRQVMTLYLAVRLQPAPAGQIDGNRPRALRTDLVGVGSHASPGTTG